VVENRSNGTPLDNSPAHSAIRGSFGIGETSLRRALTLGLMLLLLCSTTNSMVTQNGVGAGIPHPKTLDGRSSVAQGDLSYGNTGAPQSVTLLASLPVSVSAPSGWTGEALRGSIEHLSTRIAQVKNGLLDDYHSEHFIVPGYPWSAIEVFVPDDWAIVEKGDTPTHPRMGHLYVLNYSTGSSTGRDGSMGWEFNANFAGHQVEPEMEIHFSQQIHLPWREVYSGEIRLQHLVQDVSTMNDMFYLFVRVGDYKFKFHTFESGYTTEQWIETVVQIPMSVFQDIGIPGAVNLDIGIGTDYSGTATINNRVLIDEIAAVFEARPLPEQIGLTANSTIISGSTHGSSSPYVPDGAFRDCYDRYTTGLSTADYRVGVTGTNSDWSDANTYQVGMQFPLDIPQGAVITSARLEVEAFGEVGGGDIAMRIHVARADNVTPFTSGLPHLEDRYDWTETSIGWTLDLWTDYVRYRSPDFSPLVQEIVSRPGWSYGNYLCLMLDYMSSDSYQDYIEMRGSGTSSGDSLPRLFVDYLLPTTQDTISVLPFRKDLTIDHTKVSSDLENFPVLVDIYDTDLKTDARSDGKDIKFMNDDETLDHELELFDPDHNSTHAHLVAWVKIPVLSASSDTTISMFYGASDASGQENPHQVWEGYESVWHLSEETGSGVFIEDSSQNDHDGDPGQTTFMQDAKIDGARYFQDLANNYIPFIDGESILDGWADWQFSFWVYFDYSSDAEWTGVEPRVFDKGNCMNLIRTYRGASGWPASTATFQPDIHFDGGYDAYVNVYVKRQTWNYVVYKYESTGDGTLRAYSFADGALLDSTSDPSMGSGDRLRDDSYMFMLGVEGGGQVHLGGIDEFRTINGYRSAAWIQTEYANQYDPSSFYSVGGEQITQYGGAATLLFTSESASVVEILPRLQLNVTREDSTLDSNLASGTSFAVTNGTEAFWIANVFVNPPSALSNLSFTVEKPSTWTLLNVTDSLGTVRTTQVTNTSALVAVPSSVVNVAGIWTFAFSSVNQVLNLECGVGAAAYAATAVIQTGESAKFRGTAPVTPGSGMRLLLEDPGGGVFYSDDDLVQDGGGSFEWTGILMDSSWPCGLWTAYVNFNDTSDSSPSEVGMYSRPFIVKHASALQLVSPADAVGDKLSVKTAGELLTVEMELTDSDIAEHMAGSAVTMNWTVSGAPTQIQLEDYGNGTYGKTLDTSDLGQPGMWRINIQSVHPYLVDTSDYFDLELSHPTNIAYDTPPSTPYGDNFRVRITLHDSINGMRYSGATITSNGSIVGVPDDYGNGTYLVELDSTGYSIGSHTFEITATPSQSFVIDSSVKLVVEYRDVRTDLVQVGTSPISVPWGNYANATVEWQDSDHASAGIAGGMISGDSTFEYTDLLDGTYSIRLDVRSYGIGVYLFNFTIIKAYHTMAEITIAISVSPHRTLVTATYNSSIPVGANSSVSLNFLDLDAGGSPVPGNLSDVLVGWAGGSTSYGSLQFTLHTDTWSLGSHTVNVTVLAASAPRYYYDTETALVITMQKLQISLTWDSVSVFPIGDDFEITTYISVKDSNSLYDSSSVNGLLQSHFTVRNQNGTPYAIKSFTPLPSGTYVLTVDQSNFLEGSYGIRVFVDFGVSENYTSTQTPIIGFVYSQARSDLSSPDYPLMVISSYTDAAVTLEFVDLDRGQGIDTAIITVDGADKLSQALLSSGRYRVVINSSTWSIGVYTVNFTASAPTYDSKTISIDIRVREIRTYAIATVAILDIPIGDSQSFYVDYMDLDHSLAINPATGLCNWTVAHYGIVWTGSRYMVTIATYDTDSLGSYLLSFNFTAGSEYEAAYFNLTVNIRTIDTDFRLLAPVEDATATDQIHISLYYGDRDHSAGIMSAYLSCTVRNTTSDVVITWGNGTEAGEYDVYVDASQFGVLGTQHLTVYFNWTGSVQKYENKFLSVDVEIKGSESALTLVEAALPSPCPEYMTYTFLYSDASDGSGITNDTYNVYIRVEFESAVVDLSEIDIWEVDSATRPGEYSVGFNNTILGRTGIFSMRVFINWSSGVSPYFTNRTDVISVRVLPRNTILSVIPPTIVAYGENATFSFTYEDTTGGVSTPIAYDSGKMNVILNISDFSLYFDSVDGIYTVSFNTSQFGPPLGERTLKLNVSWAGIPFYANKTGILIRSTVTYRQTVLTYPTPPVTPYANNATFSVTLTDVASTITRGINGASIYLYNGTTQIPLGYFSVVGIGGGQYEVSLNTTYLQTPGSIDLELVASTGSFFYQDQTKTRVLTITERETMLTAEPSGSIPYNTSLSIVLRYQDLESLTPIASQSGYVVHVNILNATGWEFSCTWRPGPENYLLTAETYNQGLNIGTTYLLWVNFSTDYEAPFHKWCDVLVPFQVRARDSSVNLVSTPIPTQFGEYANFTFEYKDLLSSTGIDGGTVFLYNGPTLLQELVDYEILAIGSGQYQVSLFTDALGAPGTKSILVNVTWSAGVPYYGQAQLVVGVTVTKRPADVEIIVPPLQTQYLDNVTFDFAFVDGANGSRITISTGDISIYSDTVLLALGDYTILSMGSAFRVVLNSTVISASLVSSWNISILVNWPGGEPFYQNSQTSVFVTTVGRIGTVAPNQVVDTPVGDNMTLAFTYSDQAKGSGIEGASVVLDCTDYPGLVEGTDYWVLAGSGTDAGDYTILVDTSVLGTGQFHFVIDVLWNPSQSPYYQNVAGLEMIGEVRKIQTSLSSSLPAPSVAAFYQNISFTVRFTDVDHTSTIDGAEGFITLLDARGMEPSIWSVRALSGGVYNITLNLTGSFLVGLESVNVTIDFHPYSVSQIQTSFIVRERYAGLSAELAPLNYAGYSTFVMLNLTDYDAADAPLPGAILSVTWGDKASWVDLGNGSYNVTLDTTDLSFGSQTLVVSATRTHYQISSLTVEINLLAVPCELIVTWESPTQGEVYWGDRITLYAALNDTLRNQIVPTAFISYNWSGAVEVFLPSGVPGNYTVDLFTSQGKAGATTKVIVSAYSPNYLNDSYLLVFQLLHRPMEIIPEGNNYVFTTDWGSTPNIVVYVEDSSGLLVTDASLAASWDLDNLTFAELPSRPGYYSVSLPTYGAGFDSYSIEVSGWKENYGNASTTLIMAISKIKMVALLDDLTVTYEYTRIYWSEVVRIGVYILAPALNASYPYSTGISNCNVTWYSPELCQQGVLMNGTAIGGPGYFYFDFNTSESDAHPHSFIISAENPNKDYTDAENVTTILVEFLPTTIETEGLLDLIWGWNGLLNFTYCDTYRNISVQAEAATFEWPNANGDLTCLATGAYGVPLNTTSLRPGTYPLTISFRKLNYKDSQITVAVSVKPVPTEINLGISEVYRIGDSWENLRVPYGDSLTIVLEYSDTWNHCGIPLATSNGTTFTGPGFYQMPLELIDVGDGNYTFLLETNLYQLNSELVFNIRLTLENHTAAEFAFHVWIIPIPTSLEIQGQSQLSLYYGHNATFWIVYQDDWPTHGGAGITDAAISIASDYDAYATLEYLGPDVSRPGWHQFRVVASRQAGVAEFTIAFNKTNYVSRSESLTVSVSPSEADIAMQNAMTFGSAAFLIILLSTVVYVRVLRVPKMIRTLSAQIRQLRRKRVPKPAKEVRRREVVIAELFAEMLQPTGAKVKAVKMPAESVEVEVPEIETMIVDLSILTRMKPEEVEEFRLAISKMKLSEQTTFAREVIQQEALTASISRGISVEEVLQEVVEERIRIIGGEEATGIASAAAVYRVKEIEKEKEEPPKDTLDDSEIARMKAKLLERGLPEHEIDSVIAQARKLPKEVGEMLLQGFAQSAKLEEEEADQDFLTAKEIEELRQQLKEDGVKQKEIDKIIEQAREVPRMLALELLRGVRHEYEEKKKKKRKRKPAKPVETLSDQELRELKQKLEKKGTPEKEIQSIMREAEKAPRDVAERFLKEADKLEPFKEEPIEFEDRLTDMEIEDLRLELKKRGLPPPEIEALVSQAKTLPSALVEELLKSIDAEKSE